MTAMRILHLVGRSHRRGAEQVALELAAELDDLGHHDRLLAVGLGHEGDRVGELPPLVPEGRQGAVQLLRAALALRRDLRARPVDVVLAHGAAAALVAVAASPRRGPLLAFQTILGLPEHSFRGVLGVAWRVAVRRVDVVIALTPAMGEELLRLGYRGPVAHIPNARRTERFEGLDRPLAAATLREELGVGPEVALLGLVGYLVEQKRPQQAVEVLAGVRRTGAPAHLVVAGSGPLAAAVGERAAALGVADHVSLLGHRDDVVQVLGALDVLVLTSHDEGIPGIVVEAAMAGCPVVTVPVGGVAEVVSHGRTGIVLDGWEVDPMVEAVAGLLADRGRLAEMGAAALVRGADFSMHAIARRYETCLRAETT